jgi:hypothetical protein
MSLAWYKIKWIGNETIYACSKHKDEFIKVSKQVKFDINWRMCIPNGECRYCKEEKDG